MAEKGRILQDPKTQEAFEIMKPSAGKALATSVKRKYVCRRSRSKSGVEKGRLAKRPGRGGE